MSAWANVAKIGKAKNIEGGLLAYPREGLPFLLEEGMEVFFVPPILRQPRSAHITKIVPQQRGSHLVFFDSITTLDQARAFTNHFCLVRRDELESELTRRDSMVGYTVFDQKGHLVGLVVDIEDNPAHLLLIVERKRAQNDSLDQVALSAIPFVEDFVIACNDDEKRLDMDLPSGLLEV